MSGTEQHLREKLIQYAGEDVYPYHMPGHKRRTFGYMPEDVYRMDITEIDGFDDLHHPTEILADLQHRIAMLYGADESFVLVNGSTCGVEAAISAALPFGGHILMARNCHRSAYHTVYLRQLQVTYLYPGEHGNWGICEPVTLGQIQEALDQNPGIDAVLIVSPTYEGRIADVEGIAKIVHSKGIPLIVDEAHGAHLGMHPGFASNSCQLGADLVIHSLHKTLPAMTQTAVLHVSGDLIDRQLLRRFLRIYQSSSPSYVLMASVDNAIQFMEEDSYRIVFEWFRDRYDQMMKDLDACRYLDFLRGTSDEQDIGKLVISTRNCNLTGKELADRLRRNYHLETELAVEGYCLAMFTVGDTEEGFERMTRALLEIDQAIGEKTDMTQLSIAKPKKQFQTQSGRPAIPLAKAWDMPFETLSIEDAKGRYAAEFIQVYPPGIPMVVPGEILEKEICDSVVVYRKEQLNLQGIDLSEDDRILVKVLREE